MKIAVSYSMGKDSMLALHRAVRAGHELTCLIHSFNTGCGRSWFHGADRAMVQAAADALGCPVLYAESAGEGYDEAMEAALRRAGSLGAQACVFGDIDIAAHRRWDEERCRRAGLSALLPLWQEQREKLVFEAVDSGYRCLVKCLRPDRLPDRFLGRALDRALLAEMGRFGIDICGENGEYHTIVVDGPLFRRPLHVRCGRILELGSVHAVEMSLIR